MSERNLTKAEQEELTGLFRHVLEDFEIANKEWAEELIEDRMATLTKAQEPSTPDLPQDLHRVARALSERSGAPYAEVAKEVSKHGDAIRQEADSLNKEKETPISRTILSGLYGEEEPSTVAKKEGGEITPPALTLWEDL